ncbi:response regulator FixJ [soil metagenome]
MPSVFVIEDDFAVRDSLVMLLRAEGMRARGFASGTDFFANLPTDKVACVVTDLRMPGIDGIEVVNRLAELRGDAWPVIVITGHGDISSAVSLMKAGVTDFIEKPFEPHRLIETLKGCVNRVRQVGVDLDKRAMIDRRLAQLTARERQVFDQLTDGLSNKEIAANLEISPRTVEIFRAKVMSKMEAPNLSALVRMSLGLA